MSGHFDELQNTFTDKFRCLCSFDWSLMLHIGTPAEGIGCSFYLAPTYSCVHKTKACLRERERERERETKLSPLGSHAHNL